MKPLARVLEFFQEPHPMFFRILLLFSTALILSLLMTLLLRSLIIPEEYRVGETAQYSVRSPKEFLIEDAVSSEARRSEAARRVKAVFTLVDNNENLAQSQLNALFLMLKNQAGMSEASQASLTMTLGPEQRKNFERQFEIDLVKDEWKVLETPPLWSSLSDAVRSLVEPVLKRGIIVNNQALLEALGAGGAVLRRKSNGEETVIRSAREILSVSDAVNVFESAFPSDGFGYGTAFDSLVRKLSLKYLRLKPNVFFDNEETEFRIARARSSVEPSYYKINQGELIVRAGDEIGPSQLSKLSRLKSHYSSTKLGRTFAGYFLTALVSLLVSYFFVISAWPNFHPKNRDLTLIALVLAVSFALVHVFSVLSMSLSLYIPTLGADLLVLTSPVAAGGILLQVTLGLSAVMMYLIPFAVLSAIFFESSIALLLLIIFGNIVGALCVLSCSRRASFLRAGFRVAMVSAVVSGAYLLLSPKITPSENLMAMGAAFLGGLLSGVLAAGFAPLAEYFGGYITDIKLLELASLDHPLLQELSLQAPGTWNHSLVMGHMCEVAAQAVGANSILTRVGAYYHDIGKARKPGYFIENQVGEDNRHDKLTPSMSALIIKSHVKDGVEMAKQHRLPEALIEFIPEHHGTALIEYFYDKAVKEAEEGETVDQNHYRYPGPKPQTKEAGILMLADAVEAASRTLADPSPAKIKGLVQKQINRVFVSGQLNESELTLRDLHEIAKSFSHILTGIHHRRVEYSEPAEKTREIKSPTKGDTLAGEVVQLPRAAVEKIVTDRNGEEKKSGSRAANKGSSGEATQEASLEKEVPQTSEATLKRLGM